MDDTEIMYLINEPKTLYKKGRWSIQGKFRKRNDILVSVDNDYTFQLFHRQSLLLASSFSYGLLWTPSHRENIILTRYNGASHNHTNTIENESIEMHCHIHVATQRYIESNQKAEHYAIETDKYEAPHEAFLCLLTDCNIGGYEQNDNGTDDLFD